ncbi:MAG TPA: hypothetical protein VH120_12560, partial [Gemmataceae bacterium]|nr:hypothetical protein [Gemmataceae bacterium]
EAEAELRRVRLGLLQKIVEANTSLDASRANVALSEATVKRLEKLAQAGNVSMEEVEKVQAQLAAARANLAQTEALLGSLTGSLPKGALSLVTTAGSDGAAGSGGPSPPPPAQPTIGGLVGVGGLGTVGGGGNGGPNPRALRGPMGDKLRAALDVPVKATIKDVPLSEAVKNILVSANGVPFILNVGDKANVSVSLSLQDQVPLGAALQALEDVVPGLKCYVREYGVLIALDETAPPDGLPLVDFWHKKAADSRGR